MPDIRRTVCIALSLSIVACDAPVDPPIPAHVDRATVSTSDGTTTTAAHGPATTSDETNTTDVPGDPEGSTTGDEDASTTGADTFPPTTTAGFDHTTGGGEDVLCEVDVVLSIDAADASRWALARLADQVVSADAQLRAVDVQARWIVLPWVDTVGAVDTLEGWGSDPDATAAENAVAWYVEFGSGVQVTPAEGLDVDPEVGAGLDALAAVAAWGGWRLGAGRYAVHVASSAIVEPPAAPGGYPAASGYQAIHDALAAAQVHVLAWAPAGAPGYAAPYGEAPALSYVWHDLAPEQAVPDALPPTGSMFAAGIAADIVAAGPCEVGP